MICARLTILVLLWLTSPVYADGGHDHHAIPTMPSTGDTTITTDDQMVTLTFGPVDLPDEPRWGPGVQHAQEGVSVAGGHLHDRVQVRGVHARRTATPKNYLHHILMLNNDEPSVSCDGEPLFFAGAGLEMTEARFPEGYGVKLGKGQNLMSVVAFYHKAPPTKDVMARFTMYVAPKGANIQEMKVYQVGSTSSATASSGNGVGSNRRGDRDQARGVGTVGPAQVQDGWLREIRLSARP